MWLFKCPIKDVVAIHKFTTPDTLVADHKVCFFLSMVFWCVADVGTRVTGKR